MEGNPLLANKKAFCCGVGGGGGGGGGGRLPLCFTPPDKI